jgi:hypothetical protein
MLIEITEQKPKYVCGMDLYEFIPRHTLDDLIESGLLGDIDASEKKIGGDWGSEWYEEELKMMKKLYKRVKDDLLPVQLKNSKHSKYGRKYAKAGMSLACMRRKVRNTIAMDHYLDVDMFCCHPTILVSMRSKPHWLKVVTNRDEVIAELERVYGDEQNWKVWLTTLLYGHEPSAEYMENEFINGLVTETREYMDEVWDLHKNNKFWWSSYHKNQTKKDRNQKGSFLALYLQEIEMRIIDDLICYLDDKEECVFNHGPHKVLSYEYDGFKVLKKNIPDIPSFLADINERVQKDYPYVRFCAKPMTENYEIEVFKPDEKALLELTDRSLVIILKKVVGDDLLYNDKEKLWYYFNGSRWMCYDKTPHEFKIRIYDIIVKYALETVGDGNKNFWNKFTEKVNTRLTSNKNLDGIIALAKSHFIDRTAVFDENKMLMGFENGVYDFEDKKFRPYSFDDYVTFSTGYKYEERDEDAIAELESVLRKIHSNGENYDVVMTIYATGLCGINAPYFFVLNGEGRNGKGTITGLASKAVGDDYYAQPSTSIVANPERDGPDPNKAQLHKKRLAVLQEPKGDKKLQNSNIKSLTGGGRTSARMCNSNDCRVLQHMTLIMECNKRPPLAETPTNADVERYIDILYSANFDNGNLEDDPANERYVKNPLYIDENWHKANRMWFFHILLPYLHRWLDNGQRFDFPEHVKQRSLSYLKGCDPMHVLFYDVAEKEEGKRSILLDVLLKAMKESPTYDTLGILQRREVKKATLQKFLTDEKIEWENNSVIGIRLLGSSPSFLDDA